MTRILLGQPLQASQFRQSQAALWWSQSRVAELDCQVRLGSPVLELRDEAWDDEPRLDFECPKCHRTHRSTPFYVDRERSKFNANSDTSR